MIKPNLWQRLRPTLLRLLTVAGWTLVWLAAGFLVAMLVMAQRGPLSVFLYMAAVGFGSSLWWVLYRVLTLAEAYLLGTIAGVK